MKQELERAVRDCTRQVFTVDVDIELTRPDEKFGDYATNVALQLANQLGQNPRSIAETLATNLRSALSDKISEVSVAGPGFINLRLADDYLLQTQLKPNQPTRVRAGQKVVIETNNPNPFKAMHIGHAFNAILGDTLANLIEYSGAETHRVGYHGDVGTHVGKSMWAILKYLGGDLPRLDAIPVQARNEFMSRMYVEGAEAYNTSPEVKQVVEQLAEMSFSLVDPMYRQVYETCKAWSFESLSATVARLGCLPTERQYMESAADQMGVDTVMKHIGSVFTESDGAYIFEGEKYGVFTNVFVSSRGRGLYAARDLGLMQLKQQDYHPDKSYIVTAEEQRDYFRGIIKASELCLPELNGVTTNLTTGTVKLATGKMSSRSGTVLNIDWLFDQVEEAIRRRGGEPEYNVIVGSLRYQFLKVRVGSDVVFDVNEAVAIQGNSGPYLQYAHARACSILAKVSTQTLLQAAELSLGMEAGERSLWRKISEYPEVVEVAVGQLMPHHICTYLYELAQTFNSFYEHNRVIGDARQAARLTLVAVYIDTLTKGLQLLGIPAPNSMQAINKEFPNKIIET